MPAIATGQISILDFNDAPSLTAFVTTTAQKTQVYDPPSGAYTPNWTSTSPVLQPSLFVSSTGSVDQIANASSVKWYDATAMGTALTTAGAYTVSGSTLKISQNIMTGSVYSKTFVCEITWQDPTTLANLVIMSEFTFSRINNGVTGASAISAILSNDADTVPTDSAGNNGIFTGVATTMTVYEGATDVSSSWTVTAGTPVGLTGTLSGKTYTVTAMSADTGYVDLTASRSGYSSIKRRFAVSKSKTGVAGTTPTLYRIVPNVSALQKNISNVYSPTTISVSAFSQTGTGAYGPYSGRFVISESTDGSAFTAKYTSSINESTKSHTPSAGIKLIKTQLFLAGGTSTLLDEQIIPVVVDGNTGAAGADAVFVSTYHPVGNLFKNDLITSLSVTADLYKGGTVQTSGVTYEWFGQKSGQADQGGGTGWEKLTTANQAGYGVTGSVSTATLTVGADGVANLAVFKVKATYLSKAYFDSAVFYDSTDSIMVEVTSSKGNLFKNGAVSSELECKLSQNGAEIDPRLASATVGYKYTYTWTKYNLDGNQDLTFGGSGTKTGKWISITDADINQKAVFKVEIN